MNIKSLIKLNFYTMKPLLKLSIIFLLVPIIIGITTNPGETILCTLTFITFLLNIIFSIEDKSNFNKLYGVLPIKKSNIILGKYLFSLIVIGISSIFSFIFFILISSIFSNNINWVNGFSYLFITLILVSFFISIQYPFFFKFEYSKAAFMTIAPYIVVFAIGAPLSTNLMKYETFRTFVMNVTHFFSSRHILFGFLALLISLFFIIASYFISEIICKKSYKQ